MATLEAKVIQVLPVVTGQGKNGEWKNQQIIVVTFGDYPKKICLKLNDKLAGQITNGEVKKFHYDLSSREYNGKWHTDVNVWKFEAVTQEELNHPETEPFA